MSTLALPLHWIRASGISDRPEPRLANLDRELRASLESIVSSFQFDTCVQLLPD